MTKRRRTFKLSAFIIVVIIIGFLAYTVYANVRQQQQESTYRQKLELVDVNGDPAPNFALTDQNGRTLSLDSFKGKTVILEFMDPKCTDICPLVSKEIVEANRALGSDSSKVVYLTVNVNQYYESKAAVQAFSKEYGLNKLPNWHFVTGSTRSLQTVWKMYGIDVVPNPSGDVQHSSYMFFIDRNGHEQYIANPDHSKATVSEWGQGIAMFAKKLVLM